MIQVNELRIGNWVTSNADDTSKNKNFTIAEIRVEGVIVKDDGRDVFLFYQELEPICLTPEILEQCGFEYYSWEDFLDFTHMIKQDIILRFVGKSATIFNFSACDNKTKQFITAVQYLHQLQNLYYALTSEELTIKQPLTAL